MFGGNMRQLLLSAAIIMCFVPASFTETHNDIPPAGYVPDADTAIKIAVAVWIPIYGEDNIKKQAPYRAVLSNGIWYIRGSIPKPVESKDMNGDTVARIGGVAEAEISKKTGEILRVSHGE